MNDAHWDGILGMIMLAIIPWMPKAKSATQSYSKMILVAVAIGLIMGGFIRGCEANAAEPQSAVIEFTSAEVVK